MKYTDPSGHAECVDAECKHLANPITGELIGDKEFVKSPFNNESYIFNRPKRSENLKVIGGYAQVVGAGADAASLVASGIGSVAEIGGFVAGLAGEGAGAIPGFAAGTGIYKLSGLNRAGDFYGLIGFTATALSDVLAGNSYIAYDESKSNYAMVLGTGTQFSAIDTALGLASPIATLDFVIDSVSIVDSTNSALKMFDIPPLFDTSPNELMGGPRGVNLPETFNMIIDNLPTELKRRFDTNLTTGSSL